jgi:3-phosphoinositide dependent protein kinase-1
MKFEDISSFDEPNTSEISISLKKKNTFLGTAEYLSPEVLNDQVVGPETDLWALGCILYEMFTGTSPFKEKTEYLVFCKIQDHNINYPSTIPFKALLLIKALLNPEAKLRLGAGSKGRYERMDKLAIMTSEL